MKILPDWLKNGYLRLVQPVADWLIRNRVSPNTLTTIGTACAVAGGVLYATGRIRTGGVVLGLTGLFDVLDGVVARRTNRTTVFGAFYDSTLDRIADGAVLGGLAVFFATSPNYGSTTMFVIALATLIGSFVIPYARARAESLGMPGKVGLLQRPERYVLLCAPMAIFGLSFGGAVLNAVILFLFITAWITVGQRISAVYRATRPPQEVHPPDGASVRGPAFVRAAPSVLKGERTS